MKPNRLFSHVVLGGTFDRLHYGHKRLIQLAVSCIKNQPGSVLHVGLADGPLLQKKAFREFIQPFEIRQEGIETYIRRLCDPLFHVSVWRLVDPFGPAIVRPELEAVAVSPETLKGGLEINCIRKEKRLNTLEILLLDEIKWRGKRICSTDLRMKEHEEKKVGEKHQDSC
jgi:pantetheine-phosphate adenylyltransferase